MTPHRVVLDTNCFVSALVFKKGRLVALRHLWQKGSIRPIVCRETVAELIRVLAYPKFHLSTAEIDDLLAVLLPFAEVCVLEEATVAVQGLADQSDAVFVHLARQGKADFLVSGDAHLLDLALNDIRIVSPAEFLALLDF